MTRWKLRLLNGVSAVLILPGLILMGLAVGLGCASDLTWALLRRLYGKPFEG